MADKIKWLVAALLLAGGIAAFYYFSETSILWRVLGLLLVGGVAAGVALQTAKGRAVLSYFAEAQVEMRKVVWPTAKETHQTTGIIMVVVVIVAVFLWGLDSFLVWSVKLLTGQGS
ncbi:MAG TPA: preprotein translocase subunit SecE [Gammaproteobacteria bacterium]|nr:preprotein translocase subunit SecE [Gammaproteobacteria bacterium]